MLRQVDFFKLLQFSFNKIYYDNYDEINNDYKYKIFKVKLHDYYYTVELDNKTNVLSIFLPNGELFTKIFLDHLIIKKYDPKAIIKKD